MINNLGIQVGTEPVEESIEHNDAVSSHKPENCLEYCRNKLWRALDAEKALDEMLTRLENGTLHKVYCNADQTKPIGGDLCICNPLKKVVYHLEQDNKYLQHELAHAKGALRYCQENHHEGE